VAAFIDSRFNFASAHVGKTSLKGTGGFNFLKLSTSSSKIDHQPEQATINQQ
jgi:hypothetical protein